MNNLAVNSKRDSLVQFTILLVLSLLLSILLAACSDPEEEASALTGTSDPPTATDVPPTATLIPPTDTPVLSTDSPASPTLTTEPATPNPMQLAMTEQALTRQVATSRPTFTPAPTSCNEVDGVCFWVSFDGNNCTFEGPTEIEPGPVTLLFHNTNESMASVNLTRHSLDKTVQDMIDYTNQELRPGEYHPAWAQLLGASGSAYQGNTYTWEGILKPGIHTVVCLWLKDSGYDLYFGAGIIVED